MGKPKKQHRPHEQWSNEGAYAESNTGNANLSAILEGDTHTKDSQKIVASTTIPPVIVPPPTPAFVESLQPNPQPLPKFITKEDDHTQISYDHPVDNDHAKTLTRTLTQDFYSICGKKK